MVEIKTLDPKTLKSWLDKDEAILIDVREPIEYRESYIEKAINIPLSQLLTKIHEIPDLRKKKIILQCKSGIRSMMGCESLKNDGFKENIWSLEGGIYNWSSSGFPVKPSK
jgi:rhodanese-related sulfurtransferase